MMQTLVNLNYGSHTVLKSTNLCELANREA